MTMRRHFLFFVLLLVAITIIPMPGRAQGTFPRDGNEALALRIHNWYRQSQGRLAQLEADRIKVKGFITEVAPASTMVSTAVAAEDVTKLAEINEDIAREQARCRLLEAAWEKNRAVPPAPERSFALRYGPLSGSGKPSTDPKYDQIEAAIRSFPFNATISPTTAAHQPEAGGVNSAQKTAGISFDSGEKYTYAITWNGDQFQMVYVGIQNTSKFSGRISGQTGKRVIEYTQSDHNHPNYKAAYQATEVSKNVFKGAYQDSDGNKGGITITIK